MALRIVCLRVVEIRPWSFAEGHVFGKIPFAVAREAGEKAGQSKVIPFP
jgi:hypothetical protein